MLAIDSDEEFSDLIDRSTSYILRNEIPETTNVLEIDQSSKYNKKSFENDFKFSTKLNSNKSTRQSNQLNDLSILKNRSHQNLSTNQLNKNQSTKLIDNQLKRQSNNLQVNRTNDLSYFDSDIPDELYSIVDGRKVFRLFNHIEHVKENSAFESTKSNANHHNQSNLTYQTNKSIVSSAKESFRNCTQPEDSKFCNYLNQTKFDTLIEDDHLNDNEDKFKTLTEFNNRINDQKINEISKEIFKKPISEVKRNRIDQSNLYKNNFEFTNHNQYSNYDDKSRFSNLSKQASYLNSDAIPNQFNLTSELKEMNYELDDDLDTININSCSLIKSRYLNDSKSIDDAKENDHLNNINSSINSRSNLTSRLLQSRLQENKIKNDLTTNQQQIKKLMTSNKVNQTISRKSLGLESLDTLDDLTDNVAILNETQPSYMKSIQSNSNQISKLDDDLSLNFSPIKKATNPKDNFFKTPFKRFPRSTNLTSVREEEDNKDEFLGKNKLQSTFVDKEQQTESNSRINKLNEEEIRQNLEYELQNLRIRDENQTFIMNKEPLSNLIKKIEQSNKSNNIAIVTDRLKKARNKFEEFRRQQDEKTIFDSTLLNIDHGTSSNNRLLLKQSDETKMTYFSNTYRLMHSNEKIVRSLNETETIDESKLENEKFKFIEEQLRRAELSSKTRNLLKDNVNDDKSSRNQQSKIANLNSRNSISRSNEEDNLTFDDSNDRTLVYSTNQTITSKYQNLEDQKNHLQFLKTQLKKVKELEMIKKRRQDKINDKPLRTQSENSSSKSTDTSNSLRTLSLNTLSPSSIDSSEQMNLDSILSSNSSNDSLKDVQSNFYPINNYKIDGKISRNKVSSSKKSPNKVTINNNNNASIDFNKKSLLDDSFHCKCCIKNKLNQTNKNVQTQDDIVPVNFNLITNLNRKENEEFNQKSNLNRQKTYNVLIDSQLNRKLYHHNIRNDNQFDNDQQKTSINQNKQSLNELFKCRNPEKFDNMQKRRNLIQQKVLKRKFLQQEKNRKLEEASKKNKKRISNQLGRFNF